ncbi:TPA: hypothetical protein DGH83_00740 [Candidatus Peregrinibacteria bacterium]|nr:hypothetical protein [Candidatus Peregrinibacteria bacterium]
MEKSSPRNQKWLEDRMHQVLERGFSDLIPANKIEIKFGQAARTRLGSIRLLRDKKKSRILINRLFQIEKIPLIVVDLTIAHELVHYVHGFSSPLEQKFCTPHAGGVVDKELKARGFGQDLLFQKNWLKKNWRLFLIQHQNQIRGFIRKPRSLHRRNSRLKIRFLAGLFGA